MYPSFRLSSELASIDSGLQIFENYFQDRFSSAGTPITFTDDFPGHGFSLTKELEGIRVRFSRPCDAFRGLGLLLSDLDLTSGQTLSQKCVFESVGVMWDLSRNGVLKVEALESLFRSFAMMGINWVQLYMEDVYTLPDEEFFGYGRGAYSHEELRRIDDYGHALGIEVIPCIQTLGHLQQVLQWPVYGRLVDVHGVFMVGEREVYALIAKMLDVMVSSFRTKRVHIGMDEAHGVGTGRYLTRNGLQRPFDILNSHLTRVTDLCRERGLRHCQ